MSIILPHVESISEKYGICSDLIKQDQLSTLKRLRKLLPKRKDRVATEDKNKIVYEIDCSNCDTVYFGEARRFLN